MSETHNFKPEYENGVMGDCAVCGEMQQHENHVTAPPRETPQPEFIDIQWTTDLPWHIKRDTRFDDSCAIVGTNGELKIPGVSIRTAEYILSSVNASQPIPCLPSALTAERVNDKAVKDVADKVLSLEVIQADWQLKYSDPRRTWTAEDAQKRDDATNHRSAMYEGLAPFLARAVLALRHERDEARALIQEALPRRTDHKPVDGDWVSCHYCNQGWDSEDGKEAHRKDCVYLKGRALLASGARRT